MYKIITKIVQNSKIDWDSKLLDVLWAYHIAYKVTTKFTPFQLVHGQEANLPIELKMLSLQIAIDEHLNDDKSLQERVAMLERLDEVQNQTYLNLAATQKWRKTYYDNKMKFKTLVGDD